MGPQINCFSWKGVNLRGLPKEKLIIFMIAMKATRILISTAEKNHIMDFTKK